MTQTLLYEPGKKSALGRFLSYIQADKRFPNHAECAYE